MKRPPPLRRPPGLAGLPLDRSRWGGMNMKPHTMKLILPPGWTLSAPARVSWIRTETRNGIPRRVISHPMRRTLTSPDGCKRTTDAALNATTLDYINTILRNYDETPAQVTP